ncbi:MAG TPA: protein kinase [Candidatus Limnocylindrales bacterium]|nr:protein kinase [Candidatus Limnocylindrales bacterium]
MRTVSHYELLEKVGEGGMGVVWKARDTRLDRLVAIKFLPPDKSAPDRRLRFATEARAASALNHPRIVTIYDIGSEDGIDFIAMEYVPGKTLDRLIPPKGMNPLEAVRLAIQICDALAAAHAAGIVHRDLKPANILVDEAGHVKVLDFGLAKMREEAAPAQTDATRTVAAQPKTEEGTILGTVSYMSPEQAEGKRVDTRSDIFSFGCVLYEMLAGSRAFRGDSRLSTLAAILRAEPEPIQNHAEGVPRELTRVVQRCLRKNPEDRAQTMADLKIALKEIKEESESGSLSTPAAAVAKAHSRRWWLGACAMAIIAAAAAYALWRPAAEMQTVFTPTQLTSYAGQEDEATLSPDGSQVAFTWNGEDQSNFDIYVKVVGPGKPLRLTTDPAVDGYPAWSPDGRNIAFTRGGSIYLISPLGGPERELAQGIFSTAVRAVSGIKAIGWSPDSHWIVASNHGTLTLISAETGEMRRLIAPPERVDGDYMPAISPDGRMLAFIRMAAVGNESMAQSDIYVQRLRSGYVPDGDPIRITSQDRLIPGLTWTANSRELVYALYLTKTATLWRVPVEGNHKPVTLTGTDSAHFPVISRQGNRLVYTQFSPSDSNVWRMPLLDNKEPARAVVASTRADQSPQYSPDGQKIALQSDRAGAADIWVCDGDGGNPMQLTKLGRAGSPVWSPDGQTIAFDAVADGQWQIFTIPSRGGNPRQITKSPLSHSRPYWSHDGKWIYSTAGPGIQKISPAAGNTVRLSARGGGPVESPDGKTVYFLKDNTIWRVGSDGAGESRAIDTSAFGGVGLAVTQDGIYYIERSDRISTLRFFSLSQSRSHPVRTFEKPLGLALSVSPDGRYLLYSQTDQEAKADLMLVDPFK